MLKAASKPYGFVEEVWLVEREERFINCKRSVAILFKKIFLWALNFPPSITTKLKRILIKSLWNTFYSEMYWWLHFEYHLLDLLVLDIWGLNGWAVINHVKEIDPWMQCLIRCKAAWAWSSAFPTFSSISSFHWWFFWLVYASFNRNLLTWLKWVGFEKWM